MDPASVSFAVGGAEPQPRIVISRSSSSQRLLESAPISHCMVAAAIGDKSGPSSPEKSAMVAYQHAVEAMMAGRERAVAVHSPEKPFSPAIIADGRGEHLTSSVWSYVGRLFSHKNGAAGKEADTSSQEEEEHDKEEKQGKKKKRSPWLPDPDKRWPIQGFY